MQTYDFAVLGGDLRFAFLANALSTDGFRVFTMGLEKAPDSLSEKLPHFEDIEALRDARAVIFPLPCTQDGRTLQSPLSERSFPLEDCVRALSPGSFLLGGILPAAVFREARERGIEVFDYFAREELAIKNAVPTAEGAIALAVQETSSTLFGRRVLLTGYGRVARVLARRLLGLGCAVTVAARKCADLAWAEVDGCEPLQLSRLSAEAHRFDILFNTVPVRLIDHTILRALRRGCLVIDLASKPGGVDMDAAQSLGIPVIWALSLPGRTAPAAAGEILKDTILNILSEKGGLCDGRRLFSD